MGMGMHVKGEESLFQEALSINLDMKYNDTVEIHTVISTPRSFTLVGQTDCQASTPNLVGHSAKSEARPGSIIL
jgi:hypothetical protein